MAERIQNLAEGIQKFTEKKNAFVTLKDHKDNFLRNTPCRLFNPAKTEIGKISKQYLDQINNAIRQTSRCNQWTNTAAVISWFKNMFTKNNNCKFMKFDIENFQPSISEDLLERALKFVRRFTIIPTATIDTIKHYRKSLLSSQNNAWVKEDNPEFEVAMGLYDGAEICELVGLYWLEELTNIVPK